MNTYTDEQLKRALAKMMPNRLLYSEPSNSLVCTKPDFLHWEKVLDSELFQLCWEVEETLSGLEYVRFSNNLDLICIEDAPTKDYRPHSASWRQRIPALAAVKGIEIL